MSPNAISPAASAAPAAIYLHPHDHKKGAHGAVATTSAGVGQLPVSATSSLFSSLLQSLEQTAGATAKV